MVIFVPDVPHRVATEVLTLRETVAVLGDKKAEVDCIVYPSGCTAAGIEANCSFANAMNEHSNKQTNM